jgi:hypothetical protein
MWRLSKRCGEICAVKPDALLDARVIRQIPEFGEAASVSYCRDSCECELKRLQLAER